MVVGDVGAGEDEIGRLEKRDRRRGSGYCDHGEEFSRGIIVGCTVGYHGGRPSMDHQPKGEEREGTAHSLSRRAWVKPFRVPSGEEERKLLGFTIVKK